MQEVVKPAVQSPAPSPGSPTPIPGHQQSYVSLKAYSITELAAIYNMSIKTMHRWLDPFKKDIGQRIGRYYTITQVKLIFSRLGVPGVIREV